VVQMDDNTRAKVFHVEDDSKKTLEDEPHRSAHLIDFDDWRPNCSGRWILNYITLETILEPCRETTNMTVCIKDTYEDVSNLYTTALLKKLEAERTGNIQQSLDMLMPIRKVHEERIRAINEGVQARFVSQHVSQETLLQFELREKTEAALMKKNELREVVDYFCIACGMRSWNSYHHLMRQVLPITWVDEVVFQLAYDELLDTISNYGGQTSYDVRVCRRLGRTTFHTRVPVYGAREVWRIIWKSEIGNEDILRAALSATLHPVQTKAFIYNIPTRELKVVHVTNAHAILERISEEEENTHM
jgi:hypothetical protein